MTTKYTWYTYALKICNLFQTLSLLNKMYRKTIDKGLIKERLQFFRGLSPVATWLQPRDGIIKLELKCPNKLYSLFPSLTSLNLSFHLCNKQHSSYSSELFWQLSEAVCRKAPLNLEKMCRCKMFLLSILSHISKSFILKKFLS